MKKITLTKHDNLKMHIAHEKSKDIHLDFHSIFPPLFVMPPPLFTKFPSLGQANTR